MMKFTSAIRVTFALAATTICFGAMAGPWDACVEEYWDVVEPCSGPCVTNPPTCKIVHEWTALCEFGGAGCAMGSYKWIYLAHEKFHCAAGPGGGCVCGTGQVIETGYTAKWARDCQE